jgi:hypothetical protein
LGQRKLNLGSGPIRWKRRGLGVVSFHTVPPDELIEERADTSTGVIKMPTAMDKDE